jgi:hypothetical protein
LDRAQALVQKDAANRNPRNYLASIAAETEKWGNVIRAANIKPE